MRSEIATNYIRENFAPEDRIAVVLLSKRTGAAVQRIATAEKIASPEFQAWLQHMNAQKREVYISMNTLKEGTYRRTKQDVDSIRHVFLDFDESGTAAVKALLKREDLPEPNYLLNSSPDKWQAIWKIEGCGKDEAEEIERGLVRDTGADPAVVDVARVLRLPGFYNHKYGHPHLVTVEARSRHVSGPEHFPRFSADVRRVGLGASDDNPSPEKHLTQSERDWGIRAKGPRWRCNAGDVDRGVEATAARQIRFRGLRPQNGREGRGLLQAGRPCWPGPLIGSRWRQRLRTSWRFRPVESRNVLKTLSVAPRSHSCEPMKHVGEVALIGETHLEGHVHERFRRFREQALGPLDSFMDDILVGRTTHASPEQIGEMLRAHAGLGR